MPRGKVRPTESRVEQKGAEIRTHSARGIVRGHRGIKIRPSRNFGQ